MSRRQRGMALLIVMLMLALMVTVAASIAERSGRAWQRTDHLLSRTQAKWYALGAEALIAGVLQRDGAESPEHTFIGQSWSQVDHQMMDDGSEIRGQVEDGQACLNLNALNPIKKKPASGTTSSTETSSENNAAQSSNGGTEQTPYAAQVLRQLIIMLGEDPARADQVTDSVRDWLDEDNEPREQGAEADSYPTFLPGNQPMTDITELRAVMGIDASLYRRLLPYVCVLPVDKLVINVNSLTPDRALLLSAMFMGQLSPDSAEKILQQRPRQGWDKINDFMSMSQMPEEGKSGVNKSLALKSEWFFADIQVRVDDSEFYQRSLFHRGKQINVIQRQYGGYRTVNP
ncbi:type II secretion system minor pseudopilin GspK [Musicola keenii]|uniref:type II secretion system minor pseudopilin GspK n=1 Tax=Musicola keenii TaxID=2884250 RepID=UPI00177F854D|nr:type II secretion system minor pseudopilin GspK [Musicola keenii]